LPRREVFKSSFIKNWIPPYQEVLATTPTADRAMDIKEIIHFRISLLDFTGITSARLSLGTDPFSNPQYTLEKASSFEFTRAFLRGTLSLSA
jgi:hypothetical protein